MRTDLDRLPAAKQRELDHIVAVLLEEFGAATTIATSEWKRHARVLKVILYGSYARGGWVDEPHTPKGYRSDYDLLVIANHDKLTDRVAFWSAAEDRFNRELMTGALCFRPSKMNGLPELWDRQVEKSRQTTILRQLVRLGSTHGSSLCSPPFC